MNRLIRFAFNQFYTSFAWTYDVVASAVSFGEWRLWGEQAIAFLLQPGEGRLLEIAHGPGHLHLTLRQCGYDAVALDLSPQMGRLLRERVRRATGQLPAQLRASATRLPFVDGAFAGAVSTFPAGFIFLPETLAEVRRVLRPGSRLVIVPGATFRGTEPATRLVQFAYQITGQGKTPIERIRPVFERAGFTFEAHQAPTPHAHVAVWVLGRR